MTRPLLPPRGIETPTWLLYDKEISPAVRDTWTQLRGFAWGSDRTPPLKVNTVAEITGKSESTIYEHMRLLRDRTALQWQAAGNGEIIVFFDVIAELSENLEYSENSETPINLINSIDSSLTELKREDFPNFRNSPNFRKKAAREKPKERDPLLDNQAVRDYRRVMHLTPNHTQRALIAAKVKDCDLWSEVMEHWSGHGWSPTNVLGLIDNYSRGGVKACTMCNRANGKNGHAPVPAYNPANALPESENSESAKFMRGLEAA